MRRTGMYALNRGDRVTAWVECDLTEDSPEVCVAFRITVRGYPATFDDPAEGPEGEIEWVMVPAPRGDGVGVNKLTSAPPEIDAWARHPDRQWTLFQQALDNAGNGF